MPRATDLSPPLPPPLHCNDLFLTNTQIYVYISMYVCMNVTCPLYVFIVCVKMHEKVLPHKTGDNLWPVHAKGFTWSEMTRVPGNNVSNSYCILHLTVRLELTTTFSSTDLKFFFNWPQASLELTTTFSWTDQNFLLNWLQLSLKLTTNFSGTDQSFSPADRNFLFLYSKIQPCFKYHYILWKFLVWCINISKVLK